MTKTRHNDEPIRLAADYLAIARDFLMRSGVSMAALQPLLDTWQGRADHDGLISMSAGDYRAIIRELKALSGRQELGLLLGKEYDITAHGNLGQILLCSENTWSAIQAALKYTELRNQLISMQWQKRGESAILEFHTHVADDELRQYVMEVAMSTMHQMLKLCLKAAGTADVAMIMAFAHPRPDYHQRYNELLDCQVVFDAEAYRIELAAQACFFPLNGANPALFRVIEQQCDALLQEFKAGNDDKALQVRHRLLSQPGCFPSQDRMAAELQLAPRTLRKYLNRQGTSYQKILDEVRCELAKTYLGEPDWSIDMIANMLGYSDRYHFSAAFKKWVGETPAVYRSRLLAEPSEKQ